MLITFDGFVDLTDKLDGFNKINTPQTDFSSISGHDPMFRLFSKQSKEEAKNEKSVWGMKIKINQQKKLRGWWALFMKGVVICRKQQN